MHDLETIARLNEEAVGKLIAKARASGLYVVEVRAGLRLETFHAFRDPVTAEQRARDIRESEGPAVQTRVLPPLSASEAAIVRGRDQSEDRGV